MEPLFVQTQHIVAFLNNRGYYAEDPKDPSVFVHSYKNDIVQVDVTRDRVEIHLLYEDWQTDGCTNLADELLDWINRRPTIY